MIQAAWHCSVRVAAAVNVSAPLVTGAGRLTSVASIMLAIEPVTVCDLVVAL